MSTRKLFAVALAAVMLLSVFALPGVAAASATGGTSTASDKLDWDVDFHPENPEEGDNVTINVSVDNPTDESVNISYEFHFNGESELNDDFNLTGESDSDNFTVEEVEAGDYDWKLTVDDDKKDNGTLTVEESDTHNNFGALVNEYIEENKSDTDGPFGLSVAGFVVENNPGNAPNHAGPPGEDNDKQGPPSDKGPSDDKPNGGGPSDQAGSS